MAKYKATGCSRFLFFLIIFVPLAYFGSQYLMESGKWDEIRGKVESITEDTPSDSAADKTISSIDKDIQERIEKLLEKVNQQAETIDNQQETIHRQNVLIDQLKQQLENKVPPTSTPKSTTVETPSNGGTSLEELLKEADKALKNG